MNIKDTVVVTLSDMHSGSTVSLFPNRFWQFESGGNHTPNKEQVKIWKHFEKCAEIVKTARRQKRLIIVHDGDATEGIPYDGVQFVSRSYDDQKEIHIELMDWFLKQTKFSQKNGDLLYYVKGTEVHTKDMENKIAKDLGAEKAPNGFYAFDKLELLLNGLELWWVHHGPKRGNGANAGNILRNWLRNIYYDQLADNLRVPDMIITGHTHQPFYNTYIQSQNNDYHILHGLICPSWQMKTRYAYKVAPAQLNKIGMVYFTVTASGDILPPKFEIMKNGETKIKA